MDPRQLPVYKHKNKILDSLKNSQVIVVESPTGSGKTTQLPIILFEAGYAENGMIGVTQPRRIAAISVSDYISSVTKSKVGELVGYKMRFEDKTSPVTKIKVMTDGILLQEIKADYNLSKYNVIIVDEAHERSLNIDFILGLLKQVLERRPELKVIISSATINPEVFSEYFGGCPIVHIDSRIFPIDLYYEPSDEKSGYDGMLEKIIDIVSKIVSSKKKGDILIFLSGEKAIKDCTGLLYKLPFYKKLLVIPLYSRLSKEEQERVFIKTPNDKIKVVVATNIAETSLTVDGITSVIDSGLAKINFYNPRTFISSLIENEISKASCNQRKGRSGRTQPGSCYRIYSKTNFENRPLFTTEEIYRTDLSEVVLRMAELGIRDFMSFNFISSPGRDGIVSAVESLKMIDALNNDNSLTETGKLMTEFPMLPRISRIIVEAIKRYPEVLEETLIAAAFLSTHSPFLLPQGEEIDARKAHHKFQDDNGDFVSYLKIFTAYERTDNKEDFCKNYYLDYKIISEIYNIKFQLEDILNTLKIPVTGKGPIENYLKAIAKGLIQFVCIRQSKDIYRTIKADRIMIHPGSVMFRTNPQFIVAGEIVRTTKMFARSVSPLRREWIYDISKNLAKELRIMPSIGERREKPDKKDTTWQITIGSETFSLKPYKGQKKIAILHWDRLSKIAKNFNMENYDYFKGLRGKIIYKNYDLLSGEKLIHIFKIIKYLDPEKDFMDIHSFKKNYRIENNREQLVRNLEQSLLKITKYKMNSKTLGFISLGTDNNGSYWFKPVKNYYSAVSQSLGSLEVLIDNIDKSFTDHEAGIVNKLYSTLSNILSEY